MANDLTRRPWSIDTAAIITTDKVRVRKLKWVGATTAGHTCTVEDNNGEIIWSSVATAANFNDESSWEEGQGADFDGFEVAVIASGILYVYYQ